MRRQIILAILFLFSVIAPGYVAAAPNLPRDVAPPPSFAPDRVLVGFYPGTAGMERSAAHRQAGGVVLKSLDAIDVDVVQIPAGTVAQHIAVYEHNPNVRFATPDYRRYLYLPVTNEGSEPSLGIANNYDEQWGLENTGQSFGVEVDPLLGTITTDVYHGVAGADISAPEGWALIGSPAMAGHDVKIAIVDSGVDCTHPDLVSGGVSKCLETVNFVTAAGVTEEDAIGHGTHVATIAAAYTDNNLGTAGVAGGASIGSLKVCYADPFYLSLGLVVGVCEDSAIAEAILYAVCQDTPARAGCTPYQVINMSLAGPQGSSVLEAAVDAAWQAGSVIVAGAGNDYTRDRQYPAAYDNVIAVAATDYFDNLAYFSSFGNDWVSVAAPGHTILSAVPNAFCGNPPEGCYDYKSGTSMSTPMVAGAAAAVWAYQGAGASNLSVRHAIEIGADTTGALGQSFMAWTQHGRLNLAGALTASSGGGSTPGSLHVGDLDGSSVNAGRYWRATVTITVHDENHQPVSGATVSGAWGGGYQGAGSCYPTDVNGQCNITSGDIAKKNGSATITVSQILLNSLPYATGDNHDPDGDSDGSSITVAKP